MNRGKTVTINLRLLALLRANIFLCTTDHLCGSLLHLDPTNTQLANSAAANGAKSLCPGIDTLRNIYAKRVLCKS